MHRAGVNVAVFMALLSSLIALSFVFAPIVRADCGPSVSKYGKCAYRGDLLFCGSCALYGSRAKVSACNRCGAGYVCNALSCEVKRHCADVYSCDLCGCSWGARPGFARGQSRSVP